MPDPIHLPRPLEEALRAYAGAWFDRGRLSAPHRLRKADREAQAARHELERRMGALLDACELVQLHLDLPDKSGFTAKQAYALGAVTGALLVAREDFHRG